MLIMALDGNSLAYRAFFALPEDMANSSGQSTNAVYGFTTMLMNLARDHKPEGVVVVFDRPEPTFRHEAVPEYKAQREKQPDSLYQQLGLIRELLDALGIQWMERAGFEGDDLIATMADKAVARGDDMIIVTGDRDSYQLVTDPHVRVLYNKRGVSDYALYDEAGIIERTGVTPAQYPDYAALRGDTSDNLAGVPGVGEKTAAKLIGTYGSLDAVLAAADEQTPKLRASLHEHGERVKRNAQVMVLRRDVPIEFDPDTLAPRPDLTATARMFDFLEFKTMQKKLTDLVKAADWRPRGDEPSAAGGPDVPAADVIRVQVLREPTEVVEMLGSLREWVMAATWSGDPGRTPLEGLAVVVDASTSTVGFVPRALLLDDAVRTALTQSVPIVMHDAKPAMRSLLADGIDLVSLNLDTAIGAYLLNPSRPGYSLQEVCEDLLGRAPSIGARADGQLDFGGTSEQDAAHLCAEAAVFTAALAPLVRTRLVEASSDALHRDIENPLVRVLAKMEHVGIGVDRAVLASIRDRLTGEAATLTASLHAIAGREFNVNSPTQLREILYTEHGLTPGKKTKTGYSTDAATLEKLHDEWPEFIGPLLRFREVEKLRSTYGEGLLAEVGPDGRIHATFNQTVARTGRLSSDRPNLHNIPVRTDEGRVFRTAFVARDGWSFLVADYNQIELRCIAHLADDPGLISAFTAGEDVHSATAARVFGVDPSTVTHDQRSRAKMVSYGLAYGMEAYGLSQRLSIPVDEASTILEAYFVAFPNVRRFMDESVREARQKGYTETLFGRRRPIPELFSDNFRVRQAGERQAMNAAIQGLAADVFKIALVRIDRELEAGGFSARLVLQVHDEVLVEVPESEVDAVGPLVLGIMHGAADLKVPLEVNSAWGRTWADAKE